eukprot:m.182163 g.182163  ORF g.182163 m.182163 type:complete len:950 (-) comp15461_c0_seq1:682-3531(-)
MRGTLMGGGWDLPEHTTVVGVIGPHRDDSLSSAAVLNHILDTDAFDTVPSWYSTGLDSGNDLPGYFDTSSHVLYLLHTPRYEDLVDIAQRAEVEPDASPAAQYAWVEDFEDSVFRGALFLFLACSHVVWVSATPHVDTAWITWLKALQTQRQLVFRELGSLTDTSSPRGGPVLPGDERFVPGLSVVIRALSPDPGTTGSPPSREGGAAFVESHRQHTEQLLRRAFRRNGLADHKDTHGVSLFRIPHPNSGRPVVLTVALPPHAATDRARCLLDHAASWAESESAPTAHAFVAGGLDTAFVFASMLDTDPVNTNDVNNDDNDVLCSESGRAVLASLGLDTRVGDSEGQRQPDNRVRHTMQGTMWLQLARRIYPHVMGMQMHEPLDSSTPRTHDDTTMHHLGQLAGRSDAFRLFSHRRCQQQLPLAIAVYERHLPAYYREEEHTAALARAVAFLETTTCGPALHEGVGVLKKECTERWQAGRVLCSRTSVMGFRCVEPLHRGHNDPPQGFSKGHAAAGRTHVCKSGARFVSPCVCGKVQTTLDDPFYLDKINAFVHTAPCCASLQCTVHTILTETGSPSTMAGGRGGGGGGSGSGGGGGGGRPGSASGLGGTSSASPMGSSPPAPPPESESDSETSAALATLLQGRNRTVTVDLTAASQACKTPSPAFVVVKLGGANDYNEAKGLMGTAWIPGTNRLVPFDVQPRRRRRVRATKKRAGGGGDVNTKATKQAGAADGVGATGSNAATQGQSTGTTKNPWKTVAAGHTTPVGSTTTTPVSVLGDAKPESFVGFHYECPRGCRFINVSPTKHVHVSSTGIVKESGAACLEETMPLVTACDSAACAKEWVGPAQLTRLYVVTPSAQHTTTLAPRLAVKQRAGPARETEEVSARLVDDEGGDTMADVVSKPDIVTLSPSDGVPLEPSTFYAIFLPRAVTENVPASMALLPNAIRIV